jgi:hypothetical protein
MPYAVKAQSFFDRMGSGLHLRGSDFFGRLVPLESVAHNRKGKCQGVRLKALEAVSRRSLLSLDVLYFILADVRGGLLAVYLASIHRWDPVRIGAAMGVQILDGVGAGIFGAAEVLIIADLTRGTGRFNLMQGAVANATGLG